MYNSVNKNDERSEEGENNARREETEQSRDERAGDNESQQRPSFFGKIIQVSHRRRSSVESIVSALGGEALVVLESFKRSLRDFILQSGLASILCAIVPCLSLLLLVVYGEKHRTDKFFGSAASYIPPIVDNVTIVPFHPSGSKEYYAQSMGELPHIYTFREIVFWMMLWLCYLSRSVAMFRPTRMGLCLCSALVFASALLSIILIVKELKYNAEHGESTGSSPIDGPLALYIFFVSPFVYVLAYAFSEKRDKSKHAGLMKSYAVMFAALLFDNLSGLTFARAIFPYFFRSDTSPFMRFVVRSISQTIAANIGIEVAWYISNFSVANMGCNISDASIATFAHTGIVIPFFSRIMQGSATTVTDSIMYEVAGTIAELFIADSLLKSRTPVQDMWMSFTSIVLRRGGESKVAPEQQVVPMPSRNSLRGTEYNLRRFCETCMIVLTISEAAALIVSSTFWLVMNANPGEPGSEGIPIEQTLLNFGVMLFGELVLTDGIVAYASHKFKNRYCVNLAVAWRACAERRKYLLVGAMVMYWCFSLVTVQNIPTHMCYTSPANDESNFALTSCPKPVNITEMTRVSAQYQDEWELYN
ncbi:hypothetical protein TrRE_jg12783 [Triparma retinervis]|uniref:Uncharacterized protein n=1 Tax=Triparma retinervis TaxID=2557542 RepID=A0A9W7E8C1_9STRA|nr:hypothetical protein TrRE_jg12783 [Triparma retinervis]